MKTFALSLSLLAFLAAGSASAQQATCTQIPGAFSCTDVTPDGSVVVGGGTGGAYYWRWKQDPAPVFIGEIEAVAVSDEGAVILGDMADPGTGNQVAGIWTEADGWTPLGGINGQSCGSISSAFDLSGDGTIAVGLGWTSCSGRAFKWTEATGMLSMENLANGNNRASTISRDGAVAGGFAQGTFNRTPAFWDPSNGTGSLINVNEVGEIYGLTADGSLATGELAGNAITWTQVGGVVSLGSLNGSPWIGGALEPAESSPLIVGFDYFGLAREGWIWTPTKGFESLRSKLAEYGVPDLPTALEVATAVSDDGLVVTAHTFLTGAFIVTLPPPASATVYGCGLNPVGSMSVVSGLPELGTTITLGVDNPLGTQPGGSFAALVLAAKPLATFPCGLAAPGYGMSAPGAAGELLIDPLSPYFVWPVGAVWPGPGTPAPIGIGIPPDPTLSGLHLYTQGILWDHTGTSGIDFALTDAVDLRIGP